MNAVDIPEISRLTIPEKILFVEDLWENIRSYESDVPVPPGHQKELDKRFKKYKASPGDILSLEQLKEKIETRK